MEPISASTDDGTRYLRMLLLGIAKCGKSCVSIATSPGKVYVINCDDPSAIDPPKRLTKNFDWNLVETPEAMESALKIAKNGVREGKYKTVVLDTLSNYAARLEDICLEQAGAAGPMRAYPAYERNLRNVLYRLFKLDAHVIVCSHYMELPGKMDSQLEKSGDGIAPLLAGKARGTIPGLFTDVLFMGQESKTDERFFLTGPQGAFGPGIGSRSLDKVQKVPASIAEFLKLKAAGGKAPDNGKSTPSKIAAVKK